jgi:hypothetical protein
VIAALAAGALASAGILLVTVTADETPVGGAEVEVRASGQDALLAHARTGANGRAPALEVPPGLYDVEVHSKGLPFAALHDVVVRSMDRFPLAVPLDTLHTRYAPGETLPVASGVVMDGQGRPVSGALVAGWLQTIHFGVPTRPARIHTDRDGTFRFAALPHADITVEARWGTDADRQLGCHTYEGCRPRTVLRLRPDLPAPSARVPNVMEWTAPPSYLAQAESHLHARIVGAAPDADVVVALLPLARRKPELVHAIARAYVGGTCIDCYPSRLPWQRFRTHGEDLDLDGVSEEEMDVRVETPLGNAEARLAAGAGSRDVTIHLVGTAGVRGRGLYSTGNPIDGRACLSVRENGDELRCVAITNGTFELSRLPPGPSRLTVSAMGMLPYVRDLDSKDGEIVDVGDVTLPDEPKSR